MTNWTQTSWTHNGYTYMRTVNGIRVLIERSRGYETTYETYEIIDGIEMYRGDFHLQTPPSVMMLWLRNGAGE